jgi:regulator of cell morphogenesis and NO signaling
VHFEKMSAAELIEHIVNKHHAFVKSATPVMQAHLEKALARHGAGHPELQKIFDLFMRVKLEMDQHMFKEEYVLFPRIKTLETSQPE